MEKIIPTEKDIKQIEDMAGLGLTQKEIALILGWSSKTLERKLEKIEEVAIAYKRGRAIAKKKVTKKLFSLIEKGHPASIFFYLKCQCGWREVKEEEAEAKQNIVIYLPEKDRDS